MSDLGAENLGRVGPFQGRGQSHDLRQDPAGTCVGHDAQLCRIRSEPRIVRSEANVHRECHRRAHTDGGAIDRGDDGLRTVEYRKRDAASRIAHAPYDLRVVQAPVRSSIVGCRISSSPNTCRFRRRFRLAPFRRRRHGPLQLRQWPAPRHPGSQCQTRPPVRWPSGP